MAGRKIGGDGGASLVKTALQAIAGKILKIFGLFDLTSGRKYGTCYYG
jgi:hypothetical protein